LGIGALLIWEHRAAAHIELAFFRINAVLSFGVFGFVLGGLRGIL
jgi:hypothetical protein